MQFHVQLSAFKYIRQEVCKSFDDLGFIWAILFPLFQAYWATLNIVSFLVTFCFLLICIYG